MLDSLVRKARLASIRSRIGRGDLNCPRCGSAPAEVPAEPDDLLCCDTCANVGSVAEWGEATDPAGDPAGRTDEVLRRPPWIERLGEPPGDCEWRLPASGKSGGLLVFAGIWCAIVGVISGGFLLALVGGGTLEGNLPTWALIPFFGVFWAVGAGMLYAGLRAKHASHVLTVGLSRVSLRRRLFGRESEQAIPREGLGRAAKVSFYQQNNEPVFGIELRSSGGKIRFGSSLSNDEKDWLIQDINAVLTAPQATAGAAEMPAGGGWLSRFSLPLPTGGRQVLTLSIVLTLVGAIMLGLGVFLIDSHGPTASRDDPGFVRAFDLVFGLLSSGFRLVWLGLTGGMTAVGIFLIAREVRNRQRRVRLEGDDTHVYLRTYRHERIIDERAFPRDSVVKLRSFQSGNNNGAEMKGMELQAGGKSTKLVSWMPAEEVDAFVREASAAIGVAGSR